jgi:hypothetical protein
MATQTYSCGVCDKVFSRADNRNRHEAAHNYSLTCGVCGQYVDVRPCIGKSIGCPHKVHGIHQLNTPTLGFGGTILEGREQTTAFEINVLFGFILRHMETGELVTTIPSIQGSGLGVVK